MKKAKTLFLLLSAATLASCAVGEEGNASSDDSTTGEDTSLPSPDGTSINADVGKATLSATLLKMKDTKTFGVSLQGAAKVNTTYTSQRVTRTSSEPESSEEYSVDTNFDVKDLVVNAQAKDIGSSSCAFSGDFAANFKYTTQQSFLSGSPTTYDGPVSGKAYYEAGMLYADGTSFLGAVYPDWTSEEVARAKIKTAYALPPLDWSMILTGMNYLESYGFVASTLAGENGVFYCVYEMSCQDFVKWQAGTLPEDGTYSGGVEIWLSFDSSKIIGLGLTSDLNYDYTLTNSWSYDEDKDGTEDAFYTYTNHNAGNYVADLKGALSYESINVEEVPDPENYTLVGGDSSDSQVLQ